MNRTSIAVFAVALAGCSSGHEPGVPADGGVDAPAPSLGAVVGRVYTRCHQLPADVDQPIDISTSVLQALIPDTGPTGYRVVTGTGKVDGSFTIEGVPDGVTYLLQLDSAYYATARHVIEIYSEVSRRCTPAPATVSAPTPVTFQLTGMTPYATGFVSDDAIVTGSAALGFISFGIPDPAKAGDTTLATAYNWAQRAAAPLPEAGAGDDLYVLHSRSELFQDPTTRRTHSGRRLLDTFQTTGVTLQNGVATTVTGGFQQAAANKAVSFSIDRGLFDAGRRGLTAPEGVFVAITAQPLGHDNFFSSAVPLAEFHLGDFSRSTSLVQTVTNYRYADPFPASWQRTASVEVIELRSVRYPDPRFTEFLDTADIPGTNRVAFDYTGTVDVIPLQKPGGAKLGGVDFLTGGAVAFDGHTPVELVWNPVPSTTSYRVDVRRLNPPGLTPRTTAIAVLRTADTSLKLPASLFSGGQFFVFVLIATRAVADYGAGQFSASGVPSELAAIASGRFRLGASCGDSAVQAGEACDAGGETATCNIDCTTPFCGDGLRNAAAGEACDTVDDAIGCDSDCTLPVCGDNHRNRFTEDCDDGNTTDDGNGCSSTCKFNNTCGNGIREGAIEACDLGPTDSRDCNSDCSLVFCGDGHLNTAAGEECDDGNSDDTDRCSIDCRIRP